MLLIDCVFFLSVTSLCSLFFVPFFFSFHATVLMINLQSIVVPPRYPRQLHITRLPLVLKLFCPWLTSPIFSFPMPSLILPHITLLQPLSALRNITLPQVFLTPTSPSHNLPLATFPYSYFTFPQSLQHRPELFPPTPTTITTWMSRPVLPLLLWLAYLRQHVFCPVSFFVLPFFLLTVSYRSGIPGKKMETPTRADILSWLSSPAHVRRMDVKGHDWRWQVETFTYQSDVCVYEINQENWTKDKI